MALPPPPPDIFSYDAEPTRPDFVSASPVPRAVPSQPPPAPPGIKKWIESTTLWPSAIPAVVKPTIDVAAIAAANTRRFIDVLNIMSSLTSVEGAL